MNLEFRENGTRLVATLHCQGTPLSTQSGKVGWHEVAVCSWLAGTQIRAQCSITLRDQYNPAGADASAPSHFSLERGSDAAVDGSTVLIDMPIPDFILPFNGTSGWGGSTGGDISLNGNRCRCQFRIRVDGLSNGTYLHRAGRVLQFRNSQNQVIKELKDVLPTAEETLEALREANRRAAF